LQETAEDDSDQPIPALLGITATRPPESGVSAEYVPK
jgi:hypothetical protein